MVNNKDAIICLPFFGIRLNNLPTGSGKAILQQHTLCKPPKFSGKGFSLYLGLKYTLLFVFFVFFN